MVRDEWVHARYMREMNFLEAKHNVQTALRYRESVHESDARELIDMIDSLEQELSDLIDCLGPTNIDYNEECQKHVYRERQECPYFNEPTYGKARRSRLRF